MIAALAAIVLASAPGTRPAVLDLAYALGEAHGLRQTCNGRADGYWRERMSGILKAEAPATEARLQLVSRFNGGFAAAQAAHPKCDDDARGALSEVRASAAALARQLARDAP